MPRSFASLVLILFFSCFLFAQRHAIPLVNQPLIPASIAPGPSTAPSVVAFTLTVNGTGFVPGATVNWNGAPRATGFVSSSQLNAAILASDIVSPSTAKVTVVNPGPGGGPSNVVYFPIAPVVSPIALTSKVYATDPAEDLSTSALIASADVNNDGKIDIVENLFDNPFSPGGIITFLGNGDGTFQTALLSNSDCQDGAVMIGDFNNDGNPDVAALDLVNGNVCIMLGEGNGSFRPGTPVYLGNYVSLPTSPVVADFNGDGNLDIAVAQGQASSYVSVLLGNGDGTLQPVVQYEGGVGRSYAVAVGDFNKDGKLDIAVAGGSNISILFGNGDGTFQPAAIVSYGSYGTPNTFAIADFNGDGNLDMAISENDYLAVILSNGDGTFQPEVDYPILYGSFCSVVADFNNDGKLDLGCTGGFQSLSINYSASMYLGNGDGTFQQQLNFLGQFYPVFSAAGGDFNNDGHMDLAIGQYGGELLNGEYYASIGSYLQTWVQALPGSLLFPVQSIGTNSQLQNVVVTNEGTARLNISSIAMTGAYPADYNQKNNCDSGLNPGQQCTVAVSFTPSQPFNEWASVAITDNATASPQLVPLQGLGSAYLLTPPLLNFGKVQVGQSSQPQTVTVKNGASSGDIPINGIRLYGADASDFSQTNNCPFVLFPGLSCQIQVTFTPLAPGVRKAGLDVGGCPFKAVLEGDGT
jgi:FG-GAP-like repeat